MRLFLFRSSQLLIIAFFAANENESKLPLICHRFDIFFKEHIQNDDSVWEKLLTKAKLKRVQGHVITKGENSSYQSITILIQ
jgi:hypothetical protein